MIGKTAPLYNDLTHRNNNILIAGMAGSGKSTAEHGMINSILYELPREHKIVLIDPKRVELSRYRDTQHCIGCAVTPQEIERTLQQVIQLIETRFEIMQRNKEVFFSGSRLHIFIDEMADLMLTSKKSADLLQRICQIGRAANVQVICATQCPLASVIPTRIKVNLGIIIGLHTATAQHSRNIIDVKGCEELPMYGKALILYPTTGLIKTTMPMIPEDSIRDIIEFRKRS